MGGFDYGTKRPDGQHERHPTLDVPNAPTRPIRRSYRHDKCGVVTRMPEAIARTYAIQPSYYGSTFCCGCGGYFPVGEHGEFTWMNEDGTETTERVGT